MRERNNDFTRQAQIACIDNSINQARLTICVADDKLGQQFLSGNFDKLLVSRLIAQMLILPLGRSRLISPSTSY